MRHLTSASLTDVSVNAVAPLARRSFVERGRSAARLGALAVLDVAVMTTFLLGFALLCG